MSAPFFHQSIHGLQLSFTKAFMVCNYLSPKHSESIFHQSLPCLPLSFTKAFTVCHYLSPKHSLSATIFYQSIHQLHLSSKRHSRSVTIFHQSIQGLQLSFTKAFTVCNYLSPKHSMSAAAVLPNHRDLSLNHSLPAAIFRHSICSVFYTIFCYLH